MYNTSSSYRTAIGRGDRKYLVSAIITLENGTDLRLDNDTLWDNGGFSKEEAVSEDNRFTALGAAVIGTASLSIKNLDDSFSMYDFNNATVLTYIELDGVTDSKFQTGRYTVDSATYTEASINLTLLDHMEKFDRPYESSLFVSGSSVTLYDIIDEICENCGVSLYTSTFPNYDTEITNGFNTENLTCREVIGMAAALAGCYAKCTPDGKLKLAWFDRTTLDAWISDYTSDGIVSASDYVNLHYFTSLFSQDISVDPIIITGVQTVVERTGNDHTKTTETALTGSEGYIISIEKNNILDAMTDAQIQAVRENLADLLVGMRFRKASITHSSDPSIEAGDIAVVWDRKNRGYPILVTRTNFTVHDHQKTVCGCETPLRNSATRYSWVSKSYAKTREELNERISEWDRKQQELQEAIAGASGMYLTKTGNDNSPIYIFHNYQDPDESPVKIMVSTAGITVTANGNESNPTWFGLEPTGDMLTNLLTTHGIRFDWAKGGKLMLGGAGNDNGVLELKDAEGNLVIRVDNEGFKGFNTSGTRKVKISADGIEATGTLTMLSGDSSYQVYATTGKVPYGYSLSDGVVPTPIGWKEDDFGFTVTKRNVSATKTYSSYSVFPAVVKDTSGNDVQEIQEQYFGAVCRKTYLLGNENYATICQTTMTKNYLYWANLGTMDEFEINHSQSRIKATAGESSFLIKYGSLNITGTSSDNASLYITGSRQTINDNQIMFSSSSSRRYKHDISYDICDGLDPHRILDLKVAQFVFNDGHVLQYRDMKGLLMLGLIAEDVEEIYPSATIHDNEGRVESWDVRRIVPAMLALIQEQEERIEKLETITGTQEKKIGELEDRLKRLEKLVDMYI